MAQITPQEALAYQKRWKVIRAFQIKEYRSASPKQKFLQFLCLMVSSNLFKKRSKKRLAENFSVGRRWLKLKKIAQNDL